MAAIKLTKNTWHIQGIYDRILIGCYAMFISVDELDKLLRITTENKVYGILFNKGRFIDEKLFNVDKNTIKTTDGQAY
jgi:hypothetical protein